MQTQSLEELSALDGTLLLSDSQRALADKIQTPLKYIFIAMAIPLTLCNVIVFSQKDMRSASGTYIIGLNAGQLFYVVSNTVGLIWSSFVDPPYSQLSACAYEVYIAFFGGVLVGKRASYTILCLASVERLYAVVRPLHVKNFVLSKHPVIGVLSVYALSAIWHVYYLVKFRLVMVDTASGYAVCTSLKTELYLEQKGVNDAFGLAAKIFLTFISLLLQLMLNVLTVWALRRHNMAARQVQSTNNEVAQKQQERQLTVTLLCASVTYLMLNVLTVWALRRHNMAARQVQSTNNEAAKRQQERQLTVTLLCASVTYLMLSLPSVLLNLINNYIIPELDMSGNV
nr:hypothetical protein BaRGS_002844 [Batillaria attramentaria]